MTIQTLSVYGDSILKDVILEEKSGRYIMLKEKIASKCESVLGIKIMNKSRFGNTITKGADDLEKDIDAGINSEAVLIEYGGNDSDYNWKAVSENPHIEHMPNTPIVDFKRKFQELIDKLKAKKIVPVMMSLPPINSLMYFNWFTRAGLSKENIMLFLKDMERIYRSQESYSNAVMNLAIQNKCHLIDVRSYFLSHPSYQELLCKDGIHPNEKGYELIYNACIEYVKKI